MLLAPLFALAAAAAPMTLPPVDICTREPSFVAFRGQLTDAVARRDFEALTDLMDDKVRLSFGGRFGKDEFKRYWQTDAAQRDKLWEEFDDALRLGCAPDATTQAFPSMFGDSKGLDGFEVFIARPGARLRAAPSLKARIREKLNWHVLDRVDWDGGEWIEVKTPRGRRGFVHQSAVRSLIDYRIVTKQVDGRWRIIAFIAGD